MLFALGHTPWIEDVEQLAVGTRHVHEKGVRNANSIELGIEVLSSLGNSFIALLIKYTCQL